ncbi:MAG: sodium-dependent transporter [Kordiimonadaceae bacterium]|jgi:neurotransmitter:Na+ symporter, NSS family|nr:sodium-dependent transporter [Kordiimonadaceae bacterium]MBT6036962.1 sodium-dependent transporter [Kordiimonadaceae bacterium]MBT6329246.1 sodium-dependent transporter [Kordiimonadaceae bacterium]MBT7582395.1 sodium-dependent transporter [Kordiimonadaceae bacterium]
MSDTINHGMTSHWKSQRGFLFAAVGGAVGLGNIWRFPFEAGQNGGSAFVLLYFCFVVIIGFPLLSAETMLGRLSRQGVVTGFGHIAKLGGFSQNWKYIGWFIAASAFILCSYYSVIAGTTAAYALEGLQGNFAGITPDQSVALYAQYGASPLKLSFWHGLFMIGCAVVLSKQLNDGIEKLTSIAMPLFFILLFCLIIMAAVIGDFAAGAAFLFKPDFSKITLELAAAAMGHAFFSIGVALGIMFTFGAYLPDEISITKSAFIVCITDTLVAVTAGLCIFPVVFAFDMAPDAGPALVFNTMTVAFGQLEYGGLVAMAFFSLLAIAGFTTLLALMEPIVSYLNKFYDISRKKSAMIVSSSVFVAGLLAVFSTNILASVKIFDMNFMDLFDWWINRIGLPVGGILIAVFVGWVVKKELVIEAFGANEMAVNLVYFLIRYVCPIATLIILVTPFLQ